MIYSLVSGDIFDTIGPKSPFVLLGIVDASFAIIFLAFVACKKPTKKEQRKIN